MTKITCLNQFIAISPIRESRETESGLSKPDLPQNQDGATEGEVIDISPMAAASLKESDISLGVGDRVLYRRYAGDDYRSDSSMEEPEVVFLEMRDIICIIKE